jgi:ribonuclease D
MSSTPTEINPTPIHWIDQQASLDALFLRQQHAKIVAIDTEFVRRKTFYAELGLVQLAFSDEIALIDPLAPLDWAALKAALINPDLIKIFHAVGEDLEVLYDQFQIMPQPLFDTQIGAAYCGMGNSLSLAKLTEALLQEQLDKSETTSDWLQRPLSAAQQAYAAEDVRVLLPIYAQLSAKLAELKRQSWVDHECDRLKDKAESGLIDLQPHHKNKSADRMSVPEQQRLWALLRWRDVQARAKNLPRNWILQIADAFLIAQSPLTDLTLFEKFIERSMPTRKRAAPELFKVMHSADFSGFEAVPVFDNAIKLRINKLREQGVAAGELLALAPELIAPRRVLEGIANQTISDAELGWRSAYLKS